MSVRITTPACPDRTCAGEQRGAQDLPLPLVPSTDGAKLAVVIHSLWWELDGMAYDLPAGRCSLARLSGVAATLRQLAAHLDTVSGIVPGDADQPSLQAPGASTT